jgi:predicted DNA-binding protein
MRRNNKVEQILAEDHADAITDASAVDHPVPDTEIPMVSRSVRLPLDVYEAVRQAAEARGVGVTTLMRQFIEAGLAELDETAMVPLGDARRALAALASRYRAAT